MSPPCQVPSAPGGHRGAGGLWRGSELWEREGPTVTRTTGCSPEPLVAAADASLQTSPGTAGAPLPPNPQPGECSFPPNPSDTAWKSTGHPPGCPQLSRVRGLSPHLLPQRRELLGCGKTPIRARGLGGWAGAELLTGCNWSSAPRWRHRGFMARWELEPSIKAIKNRQG